MTGTESQSVLQIQRRHFFNRSQYLSQSIAACPEKQKLRNAAAEYLLRFQGTRGIKLLSLPSLHWEFESQFFERSGRRCVFVGVERDDATFNRGLAWMPGGTETRRSVVVEEFESGFRLHWATNETCRFLHMSASTFLRIRRTQILNDIERRRWTLRFRGWTAIWLDFTAMLCREIEMCLPQLAGGVAFGMDEVPVIVSCMKAREGDDIQNKLAALNTDRAGYIARLLDTGHPNKFFVTDDVIEYTSSRGIPMLNVFGRLVLRGGQAGKREIFALDEAYA